MVVTRNATGLAILMSLCLPPGCGAPQPLDLTASAAVRPPAFQAPVPESFRLANGLTVWKLPSARVPLSTLTLLVRAGSAFDPAGKEGLAALTATMLDEGAGALAAIALAEEIDHLGAQLAIETEKEYTQLSLEVLQSNLDRALDLLADIVVRPAFAAEEWERVKTLWLNDLAQRREEPREVARVAGERVFYGEGHPFAHPAEGYEASAKAVELEEVKAFYRERYRPGNAILLFAGGLPAADLAARLERRFGSWEAGAVREASPRPAPAAPPGKLIIIDKPQAPQTEIRILVPAPAFADPATAPVLLANMAFGGTFTSRLMSNLRERQKFTYGASSGFAPRAASGHLVAASAVHAQKTGAALVEFCREYRRLEAGDLSAGELGKAHALYRSRVLEALESQASSLELYVVSAALGSPPEERREFYRRLQGLELEEVARAARGIFLWDRATVVLVGDRRSIENQLNGPGAALPGDVEGKPFVVPAADVRGREGEAVGAERRRS
jgi:zinc protease